MASFFWFEVLAIASYTSISTHVFDVFLLISVILKLSISRFFVNSANYLTNLFPSGVYLL